MPALPADDGVGAQVAGGGIGDVHRPALSLAIAGFLAKQFGEHAVRVCALGEAVAVAAVRAGDVIFLPERVANAHGDGFFADIKMRQARHNGAGIQVVDLLFKQPDRHHPAIGPQPLFGGGFVRTAIVYGHNRFHRTPGYAGYF